MKPTSSVIVALMTCALVVNGWGRSSIAQILPPDGWRGTSFCTYQPIMSGNTVVLKCTILNLWLSYSLGQWCRREDCPECYFSKPSSQSLGKMFQIYSAWLVVVTSQWGTKKLSTIRWRSDLNAGSGTATSTLVQGTPHMNMNLLILTSGTMWWSIHHLCLR